MYLYSNLLADYSTYSVASLNASTYAGIANGPTYLSGSASGSSTSQALAAGSEDYRSSIAGTSSTTFTAHGTPNLRSTSAGSSSTSGTATGAEDYLSGLNGVSVSIGTATGIAVRAGSTSKPRRIIAQQPPIVAAPSYTPTPLPTHLMESAIGISRSIGMVVGTANLTPTLKTITTIIEPIAIGRANYHAAIFRKTRTHSYSHGHKIEARDIQDAKDLSTLILLGL